MAGAGGTCRVAALGLVAGAGGGAAAGGAVGAAEASGSSPWTVRVLTLRGSLFGIVPLGAADGIALVATLAGGGGLALAFSGGNTTRGPAALALTSTGVSSRGTSFSVPSPAGMRSGVLPESVDAGTTLVGELSVLMIGGSPLRAEPT